MIAIPQTKEVAELLGLTIGELSTLDEFELQTKVLEWWVKHMGTVYDS